MSFAKFWRIVSDIVQRKRMPIGKITYPYILLVLQAEKNVFIKRTNHKELKNYIEGTIRTFLMCKHSAKHLRLNLFYISK